MTAKELKEALANVPDDAKLFIPIPYIGYKELVRFVEYDEKLNHLDLIFQPI